MNNKEPILTRKIIVGVPLPSDAHIYDDGYCDFTLSIKEQAAGLVVEQLRKAADAIEAEMHR